MVILFSPLLQYKIRILRLQTMKNNENLPQKVNDKIDTETSVYNK